MKSKSLVPLAVLLLAACSGSTEKTDDQTSAPKAWKGQLADTLVRGANDNVESVKLVPGTQLFIGTSSKARKIALLKIEGGKLKAAREKALFAADASESELTNVAVSPDGKWAAATRTILTVGTDGKQTDCGGELVLVDVQDADSFGTVLKALEIGPMPDGVAISPDGKWVVTADERDGPDAWGKCEVAGEKASITVVDVSGGAAAAKVETKIVLADGTTGPREPEAVAFGKDSDTVAVTLQDSHEVAIFKVSAVKGAAERANADVKIVSLPANALGAKPWPDGITAFADKDGAEHFAVAGEWNDTLLVVDADGSVKANVDILAKDIPDSLPRVVKDEYPLFSPDTLTSFVNGGKSYLAATLRHSGAVAFWDASDAAKPAFASVVQVGHDEKGKSDEDGSTVRPEGIAATADGSAIVTANEEESSLSLILPAP